MGGLSQIVKKNDQVILSSFQSPLLYLFHVLSLSSVGTTKVAIVGFGCGCVAVSVGTGLAPWRRVWERFE